jgi:diguanylate cyclase (GGDEF)-like protein
MRPFARAGLLERLAPFAGMALVAFALVPLPPDESRPLSLAVAVSLTAAILASVFFVPWDRLPTFAQTLPPLAYVPVVAFLRDAEGGGASGYAPLVLLPVIWLALYGGKRALGAAVVLTAFSLAIPILVAGAPLYPPSEWRRVLLLTAVAAIVGTTVQRLVRRQEELSDHLEQLAMADSLTGLPNRRAWDARLPAEILRSERDGSRLCIALLDLDHFKRFNDELGHPAGDSLLEACAQSWRRELRAVDVIARYGGEEFGVLLQACSIEDALETAARLRAVTPVGQTCSVGVAEWVPGEDAASLVLRADNALYDAKASGRDRVCADGGPTPVSVLAISR